mmetsp:Transcript_46798/g.98292  ORF Transcript_46798/g.98292 Transcript_46798/m.98292 type:complete len:317 (-) Transcript_46798:239-1189(-)
MRKARCLLNLSTLVIGSAAFSTSPSTISPLSNKVSSQASSSSLSAAHNDDESRISNSNNVFGALATRTLTSAAVSFAILTSPLHNTATNNIAHADEWGKETEAPTLFTGETVMICKKRGPLGACTETAIRTVENDNDKALKYFKDPSDKVKKRQEKMLQTMEDDSEGNALIQKLRKQSADNKETNDLIVRQKTLLNDQGASFGPFNGQVVILNTDGRTFTLLQNPQAMRLKKAGYIEDRKFVIQPSKEVIDEALEGKNELGDAIRGFFGGGKGGSEEEVQVEVTGEADVSSVSSEESVVAGDETVEIAKEATSDLS